MASTTLLFSTLTVEEHSSVSRCLRSAAITALTPRDTACTDEFRLQQLRFTEYQATVAAMQSQEIVRHQLQEQQLREIHRKLQEAEERAAAEERELGLAEDTATTTQPTTTDQFVLPVLPHTHFDPPAEDKDPPYWAIEMRHMPEAAQPTPVFWFLER
jgi:hypothetical protein